jgi:hypothetical protein
VTDTPQGTQKRNSRIPDELWIPAQEKAERMAKAGYRSGSYKFSVAAVLRDALRVFLDESDAESVQRLGLVAAPVEVSQ